MARLSIVIPVHNDAEILKTTLADLLLYVSQIPLSPTAFIFIENGSCDQSPIVLKDLIEHGTSQSGAQLFGESIKEAGIGYAYQRGIDIAINQFGMSDHWVMLTASDLPFGSSDLKEFIQSLDAGTRIRFFIGSKANRRSQVDRGFVRGIVGKIFYLLRRVFLGMKTGDPQGVFFVKAEVLCKLCPKVRSRNFFYSTELTYFAEKEGEAIVELPVVYQGERRASSVRVFRHGAELIRNILELRKR